MGNVYGAGLAAMLGISGASLFGSLKKPKKGLTPPKSAKIITDIVQRAGSKADEAIRSKAPLSKQINASQRSFRLTQGVSGQYQKIRDKKRFRTMGRAGALGIIASIMKPKPAGAGSDFTPEQIKAMLDKKK